MTSRLTLREAYRGGYADLSKACYYKFGKDGYSWMDEISFVDALLAGYAETTERGRRSIGQWVRRSREAILRYRYA